MTNAETVAIASLIVPLTLIRLEKLNICDIAYGTPMAALKGHPRREPSPKHVIALNVSVKVSELRITCAIPNVTQYIAKVDGKYAVER
jgi:hypothetical protein